MVFASKILFGVYALSAVLQAVFGCYFLLALRKLKRRQAVPERLPRAAILLPLKGLDPELRECLRRFLSQDYPDYELHIVIHDENDPALPVVQEVIAEMKATNVRYELFREEFDPLRLRSANSKTVQGVRGLDGSFEMIASVSGSLLTHPGWLYELLEPMVRDARVGATFGNRWYMPKKPTWGALLRYFWNAGAVPIMYLENMPWGACMGVRTSAISEELLESWSRCIAIDAALPGALRRQNLTLRFVPSLMMINRDVCDMPFFLNFVQRQLTWTRVYHSRWATVVAHAAATALLLVATGLLIFVGLVTKRWEAAGWAIAGYALCQSTILFLLVAMELRVRRTSTNYLAEPRGWFSAAAVLRFPLALQLAPFTHVLTVWRAGTHRFVQWRGFRLEIVGPGDIRNPELAGDAVVKS
jgi:cellulose synthase/poly-beta-1,6-N-acetylglucosamine synthase-like glycosyltransferase